MARRKIICVDINKLHWKQREILLSIVKSSPLFGRADLATIKLSAYSNFKHKFKRVKQACDRLESYLGANDITPDSPNNYCGTDKRLAELMRINRLTLRRWIDSGEFNFKNARPPTRNNIIQIGYYLDKIVGEMKLYLNKN